MGFYEVENLFTIRSKHSSHILRNAKKPIHHLNFDTHDNETIIFNTDDDEIEECLRNATLANKDRAKYKYISIS